MKLSFALLSLLLTSPALAAELSGVCKNSAIKAALAVEQISTNVNGCEEECDRSVKMLSFTQTKEWKGQDHIDIWSAYEIVTASERGSPRGTYSVIVSSYDLGICRIREVKQIK